MNRVRTRLCLFLNALCVAAGMICAGEQAGRAPLEVRRALRAGDSLAAFQIYNPWRMAHRPKAKPPSDELRNFLLRQNFGERAIHSPLMEPVDAESMDRLRFLHAVAARVVGESREPLGRARNLFAFVVREMAPHVEP